MFVRRRGLGGVHARINVAILYNNGLFDLAATAGLVTKNTQYIEPK